MDREFYKKFLKFVKFYMNTFYKIDESGIENIPKDTNYLLAGNHLNILDSWVLMSLLDEDILRFMVDDKLYRYKLWEDFFTKLGTFPINQKIFDIAAIKNAIKLLKDNEKVVIFPEGKTHKVIESVPFKGGVAKIATMANRPLVPFGINGNYNPFSKISITFGKPIDLKSIPKDEWDITLEKTVRTLEKR